MGRRKLKEADVLKHEVKTRVNEKTFSRLQDLLKNQPNKDVSTLVRDILNNRPIKLVTYDRSLDIVMEELSALRSEIRAIGININQIARLFNTYPEPKKKEFYAKIAFNEYISLNGKIDRLLEVVTKLSKIWLSE